MQAIRKRLRFNEHDELILLREVLGYNPWANPSMWIIIQEHVQGVTGKSFSIRSLKDHIDLLMKLWLKEVEIMKGKSGIEVEMTEKFVLCEEVYGLAKEFVTPKKKTKVTVEKSKLCGIELREKIAQTFSENKENIESNVHTENKENKYPSEEWSFLDHDYLGESSTSHEVIVEYDKNTSASASNVACPLNEGIETKEETSVSTAKGQTPRKIEEGSSKSSKSKVMARNKPRMRRTSIQKRGLQYLEDYEKSKLQCKQKDQELEEKRIKLEETKLELEKRRLEIGEKTCSLGV